jgi:hypothetical protein
MTRKFLVATAGLAALGLVAVTGSADARYVLSGKKEFGTAPMVHMTLPRDCAAYLGYRLVTPVAFAKYVKAHPGYETSRVIHVRHRPDFSSIAGTTYSGRRNSFAAPYSDCSRI